MLKQYRLRKLKEKLCKYKAEYSELVSIFSNAQNMPQFYIDKQISYQGIICELESRIAGLSND